MFFLNSLKIILFVLCQKVDKNDEFRGLSDILLKLLVLSKHEFKTQRLKIYLCMTKERIVIIKQEDGRVGKVTLEM